MNTSVMITHKIEYFPKHLFSAVLMILYRILNRYKYLILYIYIYLIALS